MYQFLPTETAFIQELTIVITDKKKKNYEYVRPLHFKNHNKFMLNYLTTFLLKIEIITVHSLNYFKFIVFQKLKENKIIK